MKATNDKELKDSYDEWYETWELEPSGPSKNFHKFILGKLEAKDGGKLLDVACGKGYLLRKAREMGFETHGLDLSDKALEKAKEIAPEATLVQGSAEALPFKDNEFDYVTCIGSVEHFLNPGKGVAEMARVAKPGGRVLIYVPNEYWVWFVLRAWLKGKKPTQHQDNTIFMAYEGWKELLESSGLEIERTLPHHFPFDSNLGRQWKISPWSFMFNIATAFSFLFPLNACYHFIFLCKKRGSQ